MTEIIQLDHVTVGYEQHHPILKDICVSVQKGEKIALLGPNGAGKSTLFLTMNGVLSPGQGCILCKGTEIKKKNLSLLRKTAGIVFQNPQEQMIGSSVFSEISFGPMNLKLPKDQVLDRVNAAIAELELASIADQPPHYLSGGQQKKVTIADILAMNPEIYLFDEPTASLDPFHIELFQQMLKKLEQQEKAMLIATHDVDFAFAWADKIWVLCQGEIIACDSPNVLFAREEILEKAHLKTPFVWELYHTLQHRGMLSVNQVPRTREALINSIQNKKEKEE